MWDRVVRLFFIAVRTAADWSSVTHLLGLEIRKRARYVYYPDTDTEIPTDNRQMQSVVKPTETDWLNCKFNWGKTWFFVHTYVCCLICCYCGVRWLYTLRVHTRSYGEHELHRIVRAIRDWSPSTNSNGSTRWKWKWRWPYVNGMELLYHNCIFFFRELTV